MKFEKTILRIALMRSAFFARIALMAGCVVAYTVETFTESRSTVPLITCLMLIFLPAVLRYYIREGIKKRAGKRNKPFTETPSPEAPETLIRQYKFAPEASWGDHVGDVLGVGYMLLWQYLRCPDIGFAVKSIEYYGSITEWMMIMPLLVAVCGVVTYAITYGFIYRRIRKMMSAEL